MGASTPTTHSMQGTDFAPLQSMGASTPMIYSAQGTDFTPLQSMGASTPTNVWHTRDRLHSFAKQGCLHTHKRMAHKGQISLLCIARVPPHPQTYGTQGTDFTPLQSTGASTPTTHGAQEFYGESMGALKPTMYRGFTAFCLLCLFIQTNQFW